MVGVNGSGKTTTIGKLAAQYHATGRKVLVVAGDTFRAAAVAQLRVWAERAGVSVYTGGDQADVASVVFDGLQQALQQHADVVLIDTAGRLHNKDHLMQELAKVVRVMQKVMPDAPHDTVLVLDATTGQTAISQVALFREASPLTGLIVTKLDGTARGGIVVNLTQQFHLPIHAIGVGEHIDDLQVFDALAFARNLVGAGDST